MRTSATKKPAAPSTHREDDDADPVLQAEQPAEQPAEHQPGALECHDPLGRPAGRVAGEIQATLQPLPVAGW